MSAENNPILPQQRLSTSLLREIPLLEENFSAHLAAFSTAGFQLPEDSWACHSFMLVLM
jgi:hypothetical protein